MTNVTSIKEAAPITEHEADRIAVEIDPQSGGFFRRCLINAAKKGAALAVSKQRGI